jgi:hypothetical protein
MADAQRAIEQIRAALASGTEASQEALTSGPSCPAKTAPRTK